MGVSVGARFGAGVLGIVGGALALVMGILMAVFGGLMGALASSNGASLAASGGLAMVFGILAILIATLFFLPWKKPAVILMALDIAALMWAFLRVEAWALALVPVLPLVFAVLLGLTGRPLRRPGVAG